jgi:hypothetical protein
MVEFQGPILELLVPSIAAGNAALRKVIERVTRTPAAEVMPELGLPLTDVDMHELFAGVLENRNTWYGREQWPARPRRSCLRRW